MLNRIANDEIQIVKFGMPFNKETFKVNVLKTDNCLYIAKRI